MATPLSLAAKLSELKALVPFLKENKPVRTRDARFHRPALIVRPTTVQHIQQCVRWALKYQFCLTVMGGGHSGHCLWSDIVAVHMGAFDQVHTVMDAEDKDVGVVPGPLVVAEGGCSTGDIIRTTLNVNLTVPLGNRPSVGTGMWLQGGIGHLARLHGLSCDSIVGVVMISVGSGEIFCVGNVPSQHCPEGTVCKTNDTDLLWALKGAGTNFGIVISVTFRAIPAIAYSVRSWTIPLNGRAGVRLGLRNFDQNVTRELPRNCAVDAYMYVDKGQLHLGTTIFESTTTKVAVEGFDEMPARLNQAVKVQIETADGVGVFDTEMYVSKMHGGHGGGKMSSFKRCLFLKDIGSDDISNALMAAMETRPSPFCYLYLQQGGGAITDVAPYATAFGCRDWHFACVVNGVWPRDQDKTEAPEKVIQWVYDVSRKLLPLSVGAYGADLGPDPRDVPLAAKAFGANAARLSRLKHIWDPCNVLAYTCPIPKLPRLIILVTGESGAGKDYCAPVFASVLSTCTPDSITTRVVSISETTKRKYAAETGADPNRLLSDRVYKEQHRPALTAFFHNQLRHRPQLLEEQFLNAVSEAVDADVLFITGMREGLPVPTLSHLVPESRLLDICVLASEETRLIRRESQGGNFASDDTHNKMVINGSSISTESYYRPSYEFHNDRTGNEAAVVFAEKHLTHFFHEDLQRLASMIRPAANFPRKGVVFRHVLNIPQQPGGLALCTSLIRTRFKGDWAKVDAIACCEAGGFVFASALASHVNVPLVLIRNAGKLPAPTVSTPKAKSHISSSASNEERRGRIEMDRNVITRGASVVVVDDVLATGETMSAVLDLLHKVGVSAEDVSIMVVAEFPIHQGRQLLCRKGFGRASIQSLLVFGGA